MIVKESDKDIIIQSRNFNTLKTCIIIGLFKFINVFDNNQIYVLLDNTDQDQIYEIAIR